MILYPEKKRKGSPQPNPTFRQKKYVTELKFGFINFGLRNSFHTGELVETLKVR